METTPDWFRRIHQQWKKGIIDSGALSASSPFLLPFLPEDKCRRDEDVNKFVSPPPKLKPGIIVIATWD